MPDLNAISVSTDGEFLFLGRTGYGDERSKLEEETPKAINSRLESLASMTKMAKEDIPITEVRRLRRIQIWRISDLIQYFETLHK